MSDPVVFIFFPQPQVIRVGLVLVGFDLIAVSILWSLDLWSEAELIFPFMAISYEVGLCTSIFIKMDIMYLTLVYGFVM